MHTPLLRSNEFRFNRINHIPKPVDKCTNIPKPKCIISVILDLISQCSYSEAMHFFGPVSEENSSPFLTRSFLNSSVRMLYIRHDSGDSNVIREIAESKN